MNNSEEINDIVDGHGRVTWAEVREVLRRRYFRALVGVRVFGQIGDGMVQAALATFVLFSPEAQATPMKIAIAFAILLLPYSFFGPFIGVLIDRWRRQPILVWTSIIRALSVILIAVVVKTGDDGILLGTSVLISLGIGRFLQATMSASTPHVVMGRELITANAFAPTAGTIASAVGGLLGVAVQKIGGDNGVIIALAISASFQIVTMSIARTIPADLLGPDSVVTAIGKRMREVAGQLNDGRKQLTGHIVALRAMMIVVFHRSAFGLATVMAIVLLRESLNVPSASDTALGELATLVGGSAVGAFIGALMTPFMVGRHGITRWTIIALVTGGVLAMPLMFVVIAIPKSWIALVALILTGLALGWTGQSVKVCCDSLVQAAIDDDHRGRVFAIYDMAVNVGLFSGIMAAALFLAHDGRSAWAAIYLCALLISATLLLRSKPAK